jgi:hypothetical protein
MFAAITVAEEIPTACRPQTPGVSIETMFTLRQMYEDFRNNKMIDFTLTTTSDTICIKNNERNEEACIHKAILAEMIHQGYQQHGYKLLEDFKKIELTAGTITLKGNHPSLYLNENGEVIINPNDLPGFELKAKTSNDSMSASLSSYKKTPEIIESKCNIHVPKKVHVTSETEYDSNAQEFINYMVHMRNLKSRSN